VSVRFATRLTPDAPSTSTVGAMGSASALAALCSFPLQAANNETIDTNSAGKRLRKFWLEALNRLFNRLF